MAVVGHDSLLPCPFCGGGAELEECTGKLGALRWSVGCKEQDGEDFCMGYQSLTTFPTMGEAIAGWNRRAPADKSDSSS